MRFAIVKIVVIYHVSYGSLLVRYHRVVNKGRRLSPSTLLWFLSFGIHCTLCSRRRRALCSGIHRTLCLRLRRALCLGFFFFFFFLKVQFIVLRWLSMLHVLLDVGICIRVGRAVVTVLNLAGTLRTLFSVKRFMGFTVNYSG